MFTMSTMEDKYYDEEIDKVILHILDKAIGSKCKVAISGNGKHIYINSIREIMMMTLSGEELIIDTGEKVFFGEIDQDDINWIIRNAENIYQRWRIHIHLNLTRSFRWYRNMQPKLEQGEQK